MIRVVYTVSHHVIQEEAVIRVVDAVLEDIRVCLEINLPKLNQRRVSCVKFVGELYNYQHIESNVVFKVLYLMLQFGSNPDGKWVWLQGEIGDF